MSAPPRRGNFFVSNPSFHTPRSEAAAQIKSIIICRTGIDCNSSSIQSLPATKVITPVPRRITPIVYNTICVVNFCFFSASSFKAATISGVNFCFYSASSYKSVLRISANFSSISPFLSHLSISFIK